MARPRPREAPVTSAVFPSNRAVKGASLGKSGAANRPRCSGATAGTEPDEEAGRVARGRPLGAPLATKASMNLELRYGRGTLSVRLPENLDVSVIRKPAMPLLPDPAA